MVLAVVRVAEQQLTTSVKTEGPASEFRCLPQHVTLCGFFSLDFGTVGRSSSCESSLLSIAEPPGVWPCSFVCFDGFAEPCCSLLGFAVPPRVSLCGAVLTLETRPLRIETKLSWTIDSCRNETNSSLLETRPRRVLTEVSWMIFLRSRVRSR